MRWSIHVLSMVGLAACNRDKGDGGNGGVDSGGGEAALVLTLDSPSTRAGAEVGYTLVVVTGDSETPVTDGAIASDLESALSADSDSLTPTLAGEHTLTATAEVDGETLSATGVLDVTAGEAATLDLVLSDSAIAAGESATYSVEGEDVYGNALSAADVSVTADPADLDIADGAITGTLPGTYRITATLDGLEDGEWFGVTAGPASTIDLTLSDTDLELGDSSTATVLILDAYGNQTEDGYALTVDGGSDVGIAGDVITFNAEGEYTVTATVDGGALSDSVGPLLIDSSGPGLDVDVPARGTWTSDDAGTVSGSVNDDWSGVTGLTVNGEDVSIATDGSFSTTVDWDFGLNVVETSATDGDGNTATDTRSVLMGEFLDYGATASGGMLVRLNEGSGGLDELEALGEGLVSATDLDALIPSPVVNYESESCVDLGWFGDYCFTWYSARLYITSPSISSTDMEIDPQSSGQLLTSFTVYNPSLNWSADGVVAEISYSGSGTITADSMTVSMLVTPTVSSSGAISATVDTVTVSSSGFDFDFDSWLYDALDYIGVDLDSLIQGYMEDAIEDAVYDEVPALLEDTFQDLEIGYSFAVSDRTYAFKAVPDAIGVDDTGLTLSLGTTMGVDAWTNPYLGEGSLYYGYAQPTWSGSTGTSMGVSGDFLNQVFYAMWGGGLLNLTMTDEDLGLDPADLALIFPDLTDLTVVAEPLLPPVVEPGTGTDLLDLEIGDMMLTLYNGPAEPGYEYLQVYVAAVAGLNVSATSSATLSAELGDTTLWFDVVYPDASSERAKGAEDLLATLVPLILPELTGALGEIEIPSIEGFSLTGISVKQDGAELGYTVMSGNITAE